MDQKTLSIIIITFLLIFTFYADQGGGSDLSFNFYDKSCPQLKNVVREGIKSASLIDLTTPAAILRLVFHDCQVQGCDASILLDSDGDKIQHSEMDSSKNFGIRKRGTIGLIKSSLEALCPMRVSCSDILVLAASEVVAMSGGPRIRVPLGRKDSSAPPNFRLTDSSLPPADIGVDGTLRLFAEKGMTVEESVAILGGHTLGISHCLNVRTSFYYPERGREGNAINETKSKNLLKILCPDHTTSIASKIGFVPNDPTPIFFDNQYFVNLMRGGAVLRADSQMPLDSRTGPYVKMFAHDQEQFFRAFSSAFLKLTSSNVLTGNKGTVRKTCNALN